MSFWKIVPVKFKVIKDVKRLTMFFWASVPVLMVAYFSTFLDPFFASITGEDGGSKKLLVLDVFDFAFTVRHDRNRTTGRSIPFTMLTESESLFKVIVKASTTTELRLMINIREIRDAYVRGEINKVVWISTAENIADGMTKMSVCEPLKNLIRTGYLDVHVQQWVIRTRTYEQDYLECIFANRKSRSVGSNNDFSDGIANNDGVS